MRATSTAVANWAVPEDGTAPSVATRNMRPALLAENVGRAARTMGSGLACWWRGAALTEFVLVTGPDQGLVLLLRSAEFGCRRSAPCVSWEPAAPIELARFGQSPCVLINVLSIT